MAYKKTFLALAFVALGFALSPEQAKALPWGGGGGSSSWGGTTGSRTMCDYTGQDILLNAVENDTGTQLADGQPGVHAFGVSATFEDNGSADTITRNDGGSWVDDGFVAGMKIAVKGSGLNDSVKTGNNESNEFYTISNVGVSVLTLSAGDQLTDEGIGEPIAGVSVYSLAMFTLGGQAPCRQVQDDGSQGPSVLVNFDISYNGINRDCTYAADPAGCRSSADVRDNVHTIEGSLVVPAESPSAPFPGCVDGEKCTLCVGNPASVTGKQLTEFYGASPNTDPTNPFDYLTEGQSFLFTELVEGGAVNAAKLKFDARYANSGWISGPDVDCASQTLSLKVKNNVRDVLEDWAGFVLWNGDLKAETVNVGSTTGTIKFEVDAASEGYSCSDIDTSTVRLVGAAPIPGSEAEALGNGWCRSQFLWGDVQAKMAEEAPFVLDTYRTLGWTAVLTDNTKVYSLDSARIVFNADNTVQFSTGASTACEMDGDFHVEVQLTGGSPLSAIDFNVIDTGNGTAKKSDYSFSTHMLSFSQNDTAPKLVAVTIKKNNPVEADETVVLQITDLVGPAVVGQNAAHILTITENPPTCPAP